MATQLSDYVANNGPELIIGNRKFTVEGIAEDGGNPNDIAVATFKAVTASYTGIRCDLTKVSGRPGAEVWEILTHKRVIAHFAIHEGKVIAL